MAQLKIHQLAKPESSRIGAHEQDPLFETSGRIYEPGHLVGTEDFRQMGGFLSRRNKQLGLIPSQSFVVQEAQPHDQCGHGVRGQLPFVDEIQQIGADLLFVELIWGPLVILGQSGDAVADGPLA